MLYLMRKYARSWFIMLAIGIIVVVFIFWGFGGFRSARFEQVAVVNDTPILLPDYLKTYNNLLKNYREKLGDRASDEVIKALNLRKLALNQLIQELLVLQAAERLGITVTKAELQDHIRRYPAFQGRHGFSEKRYTMVLSQHHLSPADFEAQERQNLLLKKTIQLVSSLAKVSDAELQEYFRLEREAVEVDYLVIAPARFLARQSVSDEEVAAYYMAHRKELREPERFRVRYLFLADSAYLPQVKSNPQEIAAYYQEHREEFARPEIIRVSQLLLLEPKGASPQQRRRIKDQALALLKRAQAGEDFAQLVRTYSQDQASRDRGGDLGSIKRGQNLPDWEKVAFGLKKGQIGLVHTATGYQIIRLEEIEETKVPALAEIRDQVEPRWREQQARQLARKAAQQLRAEMATASMAEVAAQHHLQIKETPYLAQSDPIPGLGRFPRFNQTALSLKPQEISKIVSLPNGLVIIQSLERQPSHIPPLEQIREKVGKAVKQQKADAQAAQEARKLLERLKKHEDLSKVAARASLPLHSSGFFTRSPGFLGQPRAGDLTTAAFQLSALQPYLPKPISWGGKYYLLALKTRRLPSPEEYQKERDQLYQVLLEQKQQLMLAQWLAAEQQNSQIQVYELPSWTGDSH